jgi:hypothetical protein
LFLLNCFSSFAAVALFVFCCCGLGWGVCLGLFLLTYFPAVCNFWYFLYLLLINVLPLSKKKKKLYSPLISSDPFKLFKLKSRYLRCVRPFRVDTILLFKLLSLKSRTCKLDGHANPSFSRKKNKNKN